MISERRMDQISSAMYCDTWFARVSVLSLVLYLMIYVVSAKLS